MRNPSRHSRWFTCSLPTLLMMVPLSYFFAGCSSPLDFGSLIEEQDISYDEYQRSFANENLNLQGCDHIFMAFVSTRDSYDLWLKCKMSKGRYDTLASEQSQSAESIDPFFDVDDDLCRAAPAWWRFHSGGAKRIWLRQKDDGSSHRLGTVLCFDEKTETLRLWQWSRQWQALPRDFERMW